MAIIAYITILIARVVKGSLLVVHLSQCVAMILVHDVLFLRDAFVFLMARLAEIEVACLAVVVAFTRSQLTAVTDEATSISSIGANSSLMCSEDTRMIVNNMSHALILALTNIIDVLSINLRLVYNYYRIVNHFKI